MPPSSGNRNTHTYNYFKECTRVLKVKGIPLQESLVDDAFGGNNNSDADTIIPSESAQSKYKT